MSCMFDRRQTISSVHANMFQYLFAFMLILHTDLYQIYQNDEKL